MIFNTGTSQSPLRDGLSNGPADSPIEKHRQIAEEMYAKIGKELRIPLFCGVMSQLTIPKIAEVIAQSSFSDRPVQRFIATRHFYRTLINYGPDSPEGREVIRTVNKVHNEFKVDPNSPEFHYVIYTMTHKLANNLKRIGPVKPSQEEEEEANYKLIRAAAERMGCSTLSEDYDTFLLHNRAFELSSWISPSPISKEVAKNTLSTISKQLPGLARRHLRNLLVATLEPDVVRILGLEDYVAKSVFSPPLRIKVGALSLNIAYRTKQAIFGSENTRH